MKLLDTVKRMLSNHWQNRMIAEYQQLCIRIEGLENYLMKKYVKTLKPDDLQVQQLAAMKEYRWALRMNMVKKGVKLPREEQKETEQQQKETMEISVYVNVPLVDLSKAAFVSDDLSKLVFCGNGTITQKK